MQSEVQDEVIDGASIVLGGTPLLIKPESVAQARDHVRKWLGKYHPACYEACLVTSELVSNAVRYASSCYYDKIFLSVSYTDSEVYVFVVDPGSTDTIPHVVEAAEDDDRGRGLYLVHQYTKGKWGYHDHGVLGRTVWAAIYYGPEAAWSDTAELPSVVA